MRIELQEALQNPTFLAELLGVELQMWGTPSGCVRGIATDTREIVEGDLFVAIKGDRADGNDYISQAIAAGAVAVLTERSCIPRVENIWYLHCESIQDALLRAAGKWRVLCGACVVAVTGSAGKTTTKEAIAAVLGGAPHNAGNYNSMLGMPMSVLGFPKSEFWVCELGINHVGEMEKMSKVLRPDIGVITNVGSAHVGLLGDFSTVLKEKFKLCAGMGHNGKLVLPYSLKNAAFFDPLCRMFCVGEDRGADFVMENITMGAHGVRCDLRYMNEEITNLEWPMPGVIGSSVLGLCVAVGVLCGRTSAQIREGVQKAACIPMHARVVETGQMLFLEDYYNASPEACVAALETLGYLAQKRSRVAVLGDMLELGEYSCHLHRMLGISAQRMGVSHLFTYGALASQIALGAREAGMPATHIFSFALGEESLLAKSLLKHAPVDAAVLFKASRAMQMQRVVEEVRRLL